MSTETVDVQDLREGDFLVGLDSGYVFSVDENPDVSMGDGSYHFNMGDGMVLVTFHDAQGNENYLLLTQGHPVDVRRESEDRDTSFAAHCEGYC